MRDYVCGRWLPALVASCTPAEPLTPNPYRCHNPARGSEHGRRTAGEPVGGYPGYLSHSHRQSPESGCRARVVRWPGRSARIGPTDPWADDHIWPDADTCQLQRTRTSYISAPQTSGASSLVLHTGAGHAIGSPRNTYPWCGNLLVNACYQSRIGQSVSSVS